MKSDVNNDGTVNVADAVMLHKYLLMSSKVTNWKQGDIDGNGRLNTVDLTLLKRILLA